MSNKQVLEVITDKSYRSFLSYVRDQSIVSPNSHELGKLYAFPFEVEATNINYVPTSLSGLKSTSEKAIAIHQSLPNLTREEACSSTLFATLNFITFKEYTESLRENKPLTDYRIFDPTHRRKHMNIIAGLWWGAELTKQDNYELTSTLMDNSDVSMAIMQRHWHSKPHILREVLLHLREFQQQGGKNLGDSIKVLSKEIHRWSTQVFVVDEQQSKTIVQEICREHMPVPKSST